MFSTFFPQAPRHGLTASLLSCKMPPLLRQKPKKQGFSLVFPEKRLIYKVFSQVTMEDLKC
jgi:hypothetical protein